jgi:predicted GTPase
MSEHAKIGNEGIDYDRVVKRLKALAESAKQQNVKMLLVGQSGVGKSSTINALLGEEVAPVGRYRPETLNVITYEKVVNGIPCIVYDTPGLCARPGSSEPEVETLSRVRQEVTDFHVLLFVTRLDFHRVTTDEYTTMQRITTALGARCWEYALIVFTHADKVDGDHYADDVRVRGDLLREVIADVSDQSLAASVPAVAVTNASAETPDGNPWLPELFLTIFDRISPKAALPFALATATPLQSDDVESGRRIQLSEAQGARYVDSAQRKGEDPVGALALTYFGAFPVAMAAGAVFGPPGFVVGALGVVTVGLGATIWSLFKD